MKQNQDPRDEFLYSQPDPSVTGEFFRNFARAASRPEEKLMLAVLEDAISCFLNHGGARSVAERRLFQEAEEWIFRRDEEWIFSFDNVCSALGFDPDFLRRGLRREVEPSPRGAAGSRLRRGTKAGGAKKRRKYRAAA